MKKYYPAFIILIPALLILLAFTEGPPAGNTGSPLDGQNCTNCHGFLPAGNLAGWISSDIPTEGYTPEETYTVTVTAIGIVAVKMGFQITSESQVEKEGTFIITDLARTQLKGSTTVTHTTAGTEITQLPATWIMDWVAPSSGTGDITFYTAVNQTNNDNTSSGDLIFVSSLVVAEATVGIAEDLNDKAWHCYPNPFTTSTTLSYTLEKPSSVTISIFNPQGQLIEKIEQEQPKGKQQVQWNAEGLPAGMYYFRIQAGEKVGGGKMVKMR